MRPSDLNLPPAFATFRPLQWGAIEQIATSPHTTFLLDAPPGSGKSLINAAVAQLFGGRTLYLIGTKGLQRQVTDEFAALHTRPIYGKANYDCRLIADTTADRAPCNFGEQCRWRDSGCHYFDALNAAAAGNLVVSNYAQWLAMAKYSDPTALGQFDTLICDEAHSIDHWVTGAVEVTLERSAVRRYLSLDLPTADGWRKWAKEAHTVARNNYKQLRSTLDREHLWEFTELGTGLQRLATLPQNERWIFDDSAKQAKRSVTISPLWPAKYVDDWLFRGIGRIILSSATLHPSMLPHLGVDILATEHVTVPSTFPHVRRPFYYWPIAKVDNKTTTGQRALLTAAFDRFIGDRAALGRKGLLQTTSYEWASDYIARSQLGRIIVTHKSSRDFKDALDKYMRAPGPAVFVSPAIKEGYDFPYRAADFQILGKFPYDPPTALVKARQTVDKDYRYKVACMRLVQMYGRPTRAPDDWSETLMPDQHFGYNRARQFWPKYFRDAWRVVGSAPPPLQM